MLEVEPQWLHFVCRYITGSFLSVGPMFHGIRRDEQATRQTSYDLSYCPTTRKALDGLFLYTRRQNTKRNHEDAAESEFYERYVFHAISV